MAGCTPSCLRCRRKGIDRHLRHARGAPPASLALPPEFAESTWGRTCSKRDKLITPATATPNKIGSRVSALTSI